MFDCERDPGKGIHPTFCVPPASQLLTGSCLPISPDLLRISVSSSFVGICWGFASASSFTDVQTVLYSSVSDRIHCATFLHHHVRKSLSSLHNSSPLYAAHPPRVQPGVHCCFYDTRSSHHAMMSMIVATTTRTILCSSPPPNQFPLSFCPSNASVFRFELRRRDTASPLQLRRRVCGRSSYYSRCGLGIGTYIAMG